MGRHATFLCVNDEQTPELRITRIIYISMPFFQIDTDDSETWLPPRATEDTSNCLCSGVEVVRALIGEVVN